MRTSFGFSLRYRRWAAYLLAFAVTGLTLLLRLHFGLTSQFGERPMLLLFVLPIFVSAFVGGLGPGLVATAIAALGASYYLIPPLHSFAMGSAVDTWDWLILILVGAAISALTEFRLLRARGSEGEVGRLGEFRPERKVQLGFGFALACLGVIGVISYTSVTQLSEQADRIQRAEQVIATVRMVLSTTIDVETAERGYVLTADETFLQPYSDARRRIDQELSDLQTVIADDAAQRREFERLVPILNQRVAAATWNLELRRNQGFVAAQAAVASGAGKRLQDEVRAILLQMEATERSSLRLRAEAAHRTATATRTVISFGCALAIGCVVAALFLISSDFAGSRRAQNALKEGNERLEARVVERTRALGESEARLGGIVGSAMDAIISINVRQRIVLFNATAEKLFGCAATTALGQPLDQFIPSQLRERHHQHVVDFGSTGVTSRSMRSLRALTAVRADGTDFPIEAAISQVEVLGEKIYTVILRDLTERKRAEEASALLASVVESSADAIVSKDLNGNVTSWNAGAERTFGYSAREMLGRSIRILIPPESQAEEALILAKVNAGECVEHFETIRLRKDGSRVDVSVTVSPIKDSNGRIVGASKSAREISERKRSERLLRESREALRLTLDAANIGHWDLDLVTHTASRSEQHDRVFGYDEPLPSWTYETFLNHVQAEDRDRVDRLFQSGVAAKTQWDFECRITRKDGAERWIWAHGNVFCNTEGVAARMLGMVSDITDRKLAETRAVWLSSFPEHDPSPILELDPVSGVVHYANPAAVRKFPTLQSEGLSHPLVSGLQALLAQLAQHGTVHRELAADDWYFSQLLTSVPDSHRVRIYSTEITDRRNAERALREKDTELHAADRRLAQIIQGMTEACFALDSDWRFRFVNDRTLTLMHRERHEVLGRTLWEVSPSLVGTAIEVGYRRAMAERVPVSFEAFSALAGRWVEVRLFPTSEGIASFLLDIQDRKMAELEREKFVSLIEYSSEFIGMRNLQGVPTFINKAALELVGLDSFERAVRTIPEEFFFPEDQSFVRDEFLPRVRREGHGETEIRFRHFKTGEAIWMIYSAFVVRDADGATVATATVSRNITERKRAEQEIRQLNTDLERRVTERTEQLEAANKELEAFSYSVSHDLRAPLRAVSGFSQIVLEDYGSLLPEDGRQSLQTICDGAQRMGMLIDDLLAFARLSRLPLTRQPVDVERQVKDSLHELEAECQGRAVEIRVGDLPPCQGDPALLKQVWLNLLSNALKYSKNRASALIEIGSTTEGGKLSYFVRDNGTGFDMQYAGKLFGVFQRLHRQEDFTGTGVGLAIVQRIVNRHGGKVWADAALDRGATFSFTLPGDST